MPISKEKELRLFKDNQFLLRSSIFVVVAIGLNVLFRIPNPVSSYVWYLVMATTNTSAWLIKTLGIEAQVLGNNILLSNKTLLINAECTAIYLMILFGVFVLVYPTKWLRKIIGLVGGILSIFTANILRLLLTAWIAEYKPQHFEYFHDYMWQVAFIILVVLLWLIWIEKVVGYERKAAISS